MLSNYNYYPQQPNQQIYQNYQRQAPSQISLKGRLVSSLEEVRATPIDFDGSIFYFPDLANKRIYTKQINMDGTATLCMYELKEFPMEENKMINNLPSFDQFVTRDEFERVLAELRQRQTDLAVPAQSKDKSEVLSF